MADIVVNDLNKYYGSDHILKGLSFEINPGEKVGLLGKNGCGKTTLFKVLTGEELYESGFINIVKGKKSEILAQIPKYPEEYSALDVINTAFEDVFALGNEMKAVEIQMKTDHSQELLKKYGSMQQRFEHMGGFMIETSINRVCNGLGIDPQIKNNLFSNLSGGEKTRINLARILLKRPDILLLDEPTNHLDMRSVEWLEEFIVKFEGTAFIISHDRYFLDRTINRAIEIEEGKAEFYAGNYSYYIVEKEARFQRKLDQYEQQQKKLDQLEKAAANMHDWANRSDNPSLHKKAVAIEKRIERMDKLDKPNETRKIKGEFQLKGFSGKDAVVFDAVSKSFGDKKLWTDLDAVLYRNEQVAVIGDNGTGKTTLLKLITGDEHPDSGEVRVGNSIKASYLQQAVHFDNPELTVMDTVRYQFETSEEKARFILAPFNFKGDDVFKTVKSLSGGEKSRLRLCMLMQGDCNLLMLDEPTNHLDLPSREWIEKAVEGFGGTVLFVSHDRYFINRFATRIWEICDKKLVDFHGTYQEYIEWKKLEAEKNQGKSEKSVAQKEESKKKNKHSFTESIKKGLEERIEALEAEISATEEAMNQAQGDYVKICELIEKKSQLETEMEGVYEKWMSMEKN